MNELWQSFVQFISALVAVLGENVQAILILAGIAFWIAWWLWGVNWQKLWPVLAQGAWAPLVLLTVVVALAWSQMFPGDYPLFDAFPIPNFWWQLAVVAGVAGLTLFCGWLQGQMRWHPPEVEFVPAGSHAHAHAQEGHEHGGGHGHGHEERRHHEH